MRLYQSSVIIVLVESWMLFAYTIDDVELQRAGLNQSLDMHKGWGQAARLTVTDLQAFGAQTHVVRDRLQGCMLKL